MGRDPDVTFDDEPGDSPPGRAIDASGLLLMLSNRRHIPAQARHRSRVIPVDHPTSRSSLGVALRAERLDVGGGSRSLEPVALGPDRLDVGTRSAPRHGSRSGRRRDHLRRVERRADHPPTRPPTTNAAVPTTTMRFPAPGAAVCRTVAMSSSLRKGPSSTILRGRAPSSARLVQDWDDVGGRRVEARK